MRLLRGYLRQAGFGVLVAHDGESAMQTIRIDKPDLLILDLMPPDRGGQCLVLHYCARGGLRPLISLEFS